MQYNLHFAVIQGIIKAFFVQNCFMFIKFKRHWQQRKSATRFSSSQKAFTLASGDQYNTSHSLTSVTSSTVCGRYCFSLCVLNYDAAYEARKKCISLDSHVLKETRVMKEVPVDSCRV